MVVVVVVVVKRVKIIEYSLFFVFFGGKRTQREVKMCLMF